MQRIHLEREFALPPNRVYAYLAEHENLGPLFGARVTRVRDGDTTRNGVGSVRRLKVGPLPAFDETITSAVPDQRLDYRISRGGPLRDHRASLRFVALGPGTRLIYDLEFGAAVPGLALIVKAMLVRSITRGLDVVARRA